jgi:UDP-N-acetylglucosamine 2-epimerase (non-hydrolysing)
MTLRVLSIFGTRPEAIKMAPVVRALASAPEVASLVCVTAQHRRMLDQVLDAFRIRPDFDLDLMRPDQDLFDVTTGVLLGLRGILREVCPDLVLVQGDTTTCLAAALAAFYERIKVGHVEAGLRTGDLAAPFPEEANRAMVGRIASYHFAPTSRARDNLLREGVEPERVWVTGNTVIDALLIAREAALGMPRDLWIRELGAPLHERLEQAGDTPVVLITGHRRENFGERFAELCRAIHELALAHQGWTFIYPVHLNPNVRGPVFAILDDLENVFLIEPLDYLPFIRLMDRATLILTDSGGIQEEAPSFGKPVLVMRDVTERPEAIEAGVARLVGTDRQRIIDNVRILLEDAAAYGRMAAARNPYGDGHAADRIVRALTNRE